MTSDRIDFEHRFCALTDKRPFPWQTELYHRFITGNTPQSCNLPTGVGKTSVIAIWLVARAAGAKVPRRLVYVVNRRTVVDQTTNEAIKLRHNAARIGIDSLAISTLRGEFADNREWSVDPSRPAIICGTVDMIGSRLLFGGYGIGSKSRPLHAGFLGQDVLLVHDEAHLEPAFQKLVEAIQHEQERCNEFANFQVMELTATTRSAAGPSEQPALALTQKDREHPVIKQRIEAFKHLSLSSVEDASQTASKIAKIADGYKDTNTAVLVFVRTIDLVEAVHLELKKTGRPIELLTGTMRGKERDDLVERPAFKRFFRGTEPGESVYLICTSAGEVGVDMSADHMVCDLSTFESMAQRLGRLHRYGQPADHVARVDVVHPESFGKLNKKTGELTADEIDVRRLRTLELLRLLPLTGEKLYDASPRALGELRERSDLPFKIEDAYLPEPTILPATDILFDAWTLTSIRESLPGRQPVEPFLHGIADWQPPETYVGWREEVAIVIGDLLLRHPPVDLLEDYPLKPAELLRDRSDRVFKHLQKLASRLPDAPVWLIDYRVVEVTTLKQVADNDRKDRINGCTVLLPPSAGGLAGGQLDGASEHADDVADDAVSAAESRVRVWTDDAEYEAKTARMRRVRRIEVPKSEGVDGDGEPRVWEWYERLPTEGGRTAAGKVAWKTHVGDVVRFAEQIVAGLSLPSEIARAVIIAAKLHDHGKRRELFQITLGNRGYPDVLLAKSGRRGVGAPEPYRHEFASTLDAQTDSELDGLTEEMRDLALHLIAAHHGRARPHFPTEEAFDPERPLLDADALASETPRRFARLQRKYGRWGLAYLESLLRAADWAASANPSELLTEQGETSK